MGIIEKLDEASKLPNVYYHKFITSYKSNSDDIYVFCEGDVDLSYYAEQLERIIPMITIHKYPVECKNNVLQIWGFINWNDYRKNRVLFFVDRDLSYWTNEPQQYDSNVYITDGYSFENDAISSHMFIKLLEDLYGFAHCLAEEKEQIRNVFEEKWKSFVEGSYDLMGYILYKYQSSHTHTAHNLDVRKCLDYSGENIWKKDIKNQSRDEYIRSKLNVGCIENGVLNQYKDRFLKETDHYSIRGKWCIEFMIGLMDYVLEKGDKYAPSLFNGATKKPRKLVELTSRGAMATIAPRILPVKSLVGFINANVGDLNA